MKSVVILALLGAVSATPALAGSSSFQRSCSTFEVQSSSQRVILKATCGNGRGGNVTSQIELYAIANIDGRLTRQASGPSSFQRSCDAFWTEATPQRVFLVADCKRRDQSLARSRIEIEDIDNIFGQLRYR